MANKRQKVKENKATLICPICGTKLISPEKSFLKGYITCNGCTGHFIEKSIQVAYPETYFKDKGKSIISQSLKFFLDIFLQLRISFIKDVVPNGKILDYGAGSGGLIQALNKNGYQAIGYEPSRGARKIAKKQKLPVFNKFKTAKAGYNLIMFWHSLEHTPNPLSTLKKIKKYLSKNGKILIAVPNSNSINAKLGGQNWFHLTYPLHKIHFNPESAVVMLKKSGFKLINIDYFNPEYTLSGLVQTLLNFILPKDALYSFVAHRRQNLPPSSLFFYALISLTLVLVFSPFILAIYFIELIFKSTDAILITACKSTKNAASVTQRT